ncbi:MAG: hypothetical protein ACRD0P_19510 [Stackebrandtia sp.]
MSRLRRLALWTVPGLAIAVVSTVFVLPANAQPTVDRDELTTAQKLKLENAWVDPAADLQFGTEPYNAVKKAAEEYVPGAPCSIAPDVATALSIAMTWPETAPSGEPPSPMTLSRYDTQPTLGDPEGRAESLWFHPGIGMWQMDSAGLGTDYTAGEAINVEYTAGRAVPVIVDEYCNSLNGGAGEADARRAAWQPWVACWEGACEDTYQRALAGVVTDDSVTNLGGGESRECEFSGAPVECLFVDPSKAQGANWWADPAGGRSPIAAPFYVYRLTDGDTITEVRYWLAADSGAATDVQASRPFGGNARDSLTWAAGGGLCDTTADRGKC